MTAVTGESRVRLRDLCERRDGDGWVIGRVATGDFIAVPEVAHRVITLLEQGNAVDEVAARLREQTGTSFAVAEFVATLDELGFLAMVDDRVREDAARSRPSLPWLRPRKNYSLKAAVSVAAAAALPSLRRCSSCSAVASSE
jgi:putative peptide zinc metalloprotease protein